MGRQLKLGRSAWPVSSNPSPFALDSHAADPAPRPDSPFGHGVKSGQSAKVHWKRPDLECAHTKQTVVQSLIVYGRDCQEPGEHDLAT